jgi:hypothetical protein
VVRNLRESAKRVPLRPLAVVAWEPSQFAKHGVRFTRGADNLDEVQWALLLVGRHQVLLQRHSGSPTPGTEVLAPADAHADDTLQSMLRAFDLSADNLLWVAPDVAPRRSPRESA